MEIYKILADIMQEQDLNVAETARKSNLPDSTVRGIITRKQKTVALEVAFKLSNGLGVSLERLNGMPDREKQPISTILHTSDEYRLLSNYRQLNNEGQDKLLEYSDDLAGMPKYKKHGELGLDSKEA